MHSPAALYTVLYSSATNKFFRSSGIQAPQESGLLRLSYKHHAIRLLGQEIQNTNGYVSDEILHSILTLASYGSGDSISASSGAAVPYLAQIQNLDLFGSMEIEWTHMRVVYHIVQERGGLHTIKRQGLADLIGLYVSAWVQGVYISYR